MLKSLKIENYTLIKECNISFPKGFSVITGETGAGKTILLGALSLVLGQRADTSVLMDKEKKCIVEAVFLLENDDLQPLFLDNDIDYDKETIFRREILPSGKSRCFVNDTPVQLSIVKQFANNLVDIHSQSSTINLKDRGFQLAFVDNFLPEVNAVNDYRRVYYDYKNLDKEIEELKQQEILFNRDKSYNEFLFEELAKANLKEDEQQTLEQQVEFMSNVQEIKDNINSSIFLFDNDNGNNLLGDLISVKNLLQNISSYDNKLQEIYSRIDSVLIEMKDVFSDLNSFNDNISFDKTLLDECNERLDLIYSLQKKHGVSSIKELIEIKEDLDKKLQMTSDISSVLDKKQKEKDKYIKQLYSLSDELHSKRIASAKEIELKVLPLLSQMAMKDAVLKIEVIKGEELTENGLDEVRFLFNANKTKNDSLSDMSKVISGGELSRLMLALKAVVAERFAMATMLFDEIDTGISGDIASKTADIMKSIADNHQVIVITHLVQVAAKAKTHFKVYKQTIQEQTYSNIKVLDKEERLQEIAQMISGDKVTKEALANAKTLLND
ncbi:MAG: DNA repair protein RecN [Bacteroidales bacterium]|nr:DNA repair protein RecN [Bacteroidales bacterium]